LSVFRLNNAAAACDEKSVRHQDATDHFMLETDAPYLAPVPHRGKRCEPAHVADTARHLATLRGISLEELAEKTTRTAIGFFKGL
jgi:Tat protein secretion system quality control protein TatD with DNase activity